MINQDKIINYLHNELKLDLYEVTDTNSIKIKSIVMNVSKLSEFVESLNYYVSYQLGCLYIHPRN